MYMSEQFLTIIGANMGMNYKGSFLVYFHNSSCMQHHDDYFINFPETPLGFVLCKYQYSWGLPKGRIS